MLLKCLLSTAFLKRRAEILKEMQIFSSTNYLRRSTDINTSSSDIFINMAFKTTILCDDAMESLKKIFDTTDKIFFLHKIRNQIAGIRDEFDKRYLEEKNLECNKDKNIEMNEYIVNSHNIILTSELCLANKELEITRERAERYSRKIHI